MWGFFTDMYVSFANVEDSFETAAKQIQGSLTDAQTSFSDVEGFFCPCTAPNVRCDAPRTHIYKLIERNPPFGGVFYLLCSLIKYREEEDPP